MQWNSNILYLVLAFGVVILLVSLLIKDKSGVNREEINVLNETQDKTKALIQQADKMIRELNGFSKSIIEEIESKHKELLFLYQLIDGKQKELQTLYDKSQFLSQNREQKEMKAAAVQPSIPQHQDVTERDIEQLMENFFLEQQSSAKINYSNKRKELDIKDATLSKKDKVMYLYNQGNTIEEISNLLHIGKGETQLIIDLCRRGDTRET